MKLLYLTEDYLYSKVHNNLLNALLKDDPNLIIYVFSPVRDNNRHGIEDSYLNNERLIVLTPSIDISDLRYKLDFSAKVRCKVRLIEKLIPIREIDVIHAGTLYSDGCTALSLKKKYGIPYLAAVRGADVMFYAKKMPHLWLKGINVILHSDSLVCVTPSIKSHLMSLWFHSGVRDIIRKAEVLNNGIDDIWLNDICVQPKPIGSPIRILYIGRFDSNKNVKRLVNAVLSVKNKYPIRLTLIGGKGEEQDDILNAISDNPDNIEYLGAIYDKEELKKIVRQCDIFAMVSHSETFGLVYAECLTQGLPLLYTSGTGFDGVFTQGEVGYGVNSYSKESIEKGLCYIIEHYTEMRHNIARVNFERFSWVEISQKYREFYCSIVCS